MRYLLAAGSGFLLAALLLTGCSSGAPDGPVLSETTVDGRTVTEINLDAIPEEPVEMGLSEFFEGMNVIRLESDPDALAMNAQLYFADDFILLGTQGSEAARLLRFDYQGNYLNEIGAAGQGPGEHSGNMINNLAYYEDDNTVLADFGALGEPAQLFRPDGTFLDVVRWPYRLMSNIQRLSADTYFSYEGTAGRPRYPRDSLKIVFYESDGTVTRRIDRSVYPPENTTEYTPYGSASSVTYNGEHKIYYPEDHTIYRVGDGELIPDAVIRPGENIRPYNKLMSPEEVEGTYDLELLSETDRYWLIKKSTINEVEIQEFTNQPGRYSTRISDSQEELLVIDKETGEGRAVVFTDDLLHMLPEMFSKRLPPWQEGYGAYLAMSADIYLKFLRESERIDRRTPEVQEKLQVLDDLEPEDNYVIFRFPFQGMGDFQEAAGSS
ncbi:MAG: 6-bladed beta-propeller [Balneolaceae bacterium]|nr:6-bladed beta-propeller [Balneolaceae bacterium]